VVVSVTLPRTIYLPFAQKRMTACSHGHQSTRSFSAQLSRFSPFSKENQLQQEKASSSVFLFSRAAFTFFIRRHPDHPLSTFGLPSPPQLTSFSLLKQMKPCPLVFLSSAFSAFFKINNPFFFSVPGETRRRGRACSPPLLSPTVSAGVWLRLSSAVTGRRCFHNKSVHSTPPTMTLRVSHARR